MNNVIEFGTSLEVIRERKFKRFKELKIKNFNDQLEFCEEKEFNEIADWIKIHN